MTTDPPPVFEYLDARPTIEVADMATCLAFFNDVAGFTTEAVLGEPPFFAKVACGDVAVGIVATSDPAIPKGAACYLTLRDLDRFIEGARAAGLEFDPPESHPWGLRDIAFACPGGGPLIAFGEPTD
jgi:hypothetical protein